MSQSIKELQPNTLYITISIPSWTTTAHLSCPRQNVDLESYETECAEGYGREEFDWGLYWHRNLRDGTWYTLRRAVPHVDTVEHEHAQAPLYMLERRDMSASPRLRAGVVGLIRVVRIGSGHDSDDISNELTAYLDWLTLNTARSATRSFVWATSCFLRTRRHVATEHSILDCSQNGRSGSGKHDSEGFVATAFLSEALQFAYPQVWSGFAGQLPRPVLDSVFGVELVHPDEEEDGDLGRRAARELARRTVSRDDTPIKKGLKDGK